MEAANEQRATQGIRRRLALSELPRNEDDYGSIGLSGLLWRQIGRLEPNIEMG
jgi:hypothetical protein